jgi:hypothetical protein
MFSTVAFWNLCDRLQSPRGEVVFHRFSCSGVFIHFVPVVNGIGKYSRVDCHRPRVVELNSEKSENSAAVFSLFSLSV